MGVAHYLLGGIVTTWAFFEARAVDLPGIATCMSVGISAWDSCGVSTGIYHGAGPTYIGGIVHGEESSTGGFGSKQGISGPHDWQEHIHAMP